MTEPGVEIGQMLRRVRQIAMKMIHDQQVSWNYNFLLREFYFIPPLATTVPSQGSMLTTEIRYWDSVEKGGTVQDYDSYKWHFPNGVFRDLARARIDGLREMGKPP
jgi:hypothetical protein